MTKEQERKAFNKAAIKRAKMAIKNIKQAQSKLQTPPEIKSLLEGLYQQGEKF